MSFRRVVSPVALAILAMVALLMGCGGNNKPDSNHESGSRQRDGNTDVTVAQPVFPEVRGWRHDKIDVYTSDELYGPIDGEADRYLEMGFKDAFFTTYEKDSGGDKIDVKAFGMNSADAAFGVFTLYDSPELGHPDFGEALGSSESQGSIDFAASRFFVRLSFSDDDADTSREIARAMIEELRAAGGRDTAGKGQVSGVPEYVEAIPEGYAEGSLRYFHKWETYRELNYDLSENVLNLSQETTGIQAAYALDEGKEKDVLLVVFYPGKDDAQRAFDRLSTYLTDEGMETKSEAGKPTAVYDEGNLYGLLQVESMEAGSALQFVTSISAPENAQELLEKAAASVAGKMERKEPD